MKHRILVFCLALLGLVASPTSAVRSQEVFVATTNFQVTGGTGRVQTVPPYATVVDEYVLHSDALVRAHGQYVFVLNRAGADNVLVLDADDGYSVVTQYSVAALGGNPSDLEVVSPGKAYLSLYESSELAILNPLTGAALGSVDLSVFADDDGLPELDQLQRWGDTLFVAVQRIARNAGWVPAGGSGLAVVDLASDTLVDVDPLSPEVDLIELPFQNPFWRLRLDPLRKTIQVACVGSFLALDGGLVEVDLPSLQALPTIVDETTLGGDLLDFVVVAPDLGYALVAELDFDTKVVRFDPTQGTVGSTLLSTAGFYLNDLEVDAAGQLYVCDRRPANPGLRIFDAVTGDAIAGPLDVGLPPYDVVPIRYGPTAAPVPALATGLRAWPNPFNPRVNFEMAAQAGTLPPLVLFDARGRQVAELVGRQEGDLWRWMWNGRSGGAEAASGRYFATVGGQRCAVTLVR